MLLDISEIKNLSTNEKLRIIDELWESIDADKKIINDDEEESPEIISMLEERVAKYERGEGEFYTEDKAREILESHLNAFRLSKTND